MSIEKNILFIVNKYAGIGYPSDLERSIKTTCKKSSASCAIEFTQRKGHAIELANEARAHGFNHVIAVGGDGTGAPRDGGLVIGEPRVVGEASLDARDSDRYDDGAEGAALKTPRVRLETLSRAHIDASLRWFNDRGLARLLGRARAISRAAGFK